MNDFITDLLKLMADYDAREDLIWFNKGYELGFAINCSDFFYWGCADCEDITPETLPALEQAYEDAIAANPLYGSVYGGLLYCARMRKMRPQKPAYPGPEESLKALWPLFDACGPERDV